MVRTPLAQTAACPPMPFIWNGSRPSPPAANGNLAREASEVTAGEHRVVTVQVDDETSIVDALAADRHRGGHLMRRRGACGTRMVDVVMRETRERPAITASSKAERASNSVICCCVSRSRTPVLALDLKRDGNFTSS